jgi:glycosyltransferase involved in cell wall biosynthesis
MRLLSVGSLPPEWGGSARGGVATFHAALLQGLFARGDEIEIVGVVPPSPPTHDTSLPIFARPDDLGVAEFYEDLLRRLDPDVVLMNHIANTVGVTHAQLADPPPAAGIAHSWHNVTFRTGEEWRRAKAVTEEALAGLAALVCPSHHCRAEGERLGLTYPRRTEVIHYPLQPLYLNDDIDVNSGGRDGVIYVGSLIERKNPVGLVKAAALLPSVSVTLVGEGEEGERLEESIEQLGLAGRAHLTALPGPHHLERLRDLFLRSSVLCLPSESESFGIVFIEALACGTPVVGFGPTVREIRETMGIDIGEPLEAGSPEEIASAVKRVVGSRWDRNRLRRAAIDAFDLSRATESYVDLLRRVRRPPAAARSQVE